VLHNIFIKGLCLIKAISMPDKAIKKHGQPFKITDILLTVRNLPVESADVYVRIIYTV
jgi:hypothetical protein